MSSSEDEEVILLINKNIEHGHGSIFRVHKNLINVIILGLSLMLIFTAFQTCSMIEEVVTEGAKQDSGSHFNGNGYNSLAINYIAFSCANWLAPSVVAVLGNRLTLFIGGVANCIFIGSFIYPLTWLFYAASVIVGIGAALIWTAQGNCLTLNSTPDTIGRNSGLFWAFFQCSLLWGNILVYFEFRGEDTISGHTRTVVFIALTCACAVGTLMTLLLRNVTNDEDTSDKARSDEGTINPQESSNASSMHVIIEALGKSIRLFGTRNMMLLSLTFAYTGLELTFYSGVFGTCVGQTQYFGSNAKSIQGLSGMFIGVGEIAGASLFGLLGSRTSKFGRSPIIYLGLFAHMLSFYIIFLMLPASSPIQESDGVTYINPSKVLVMFSALLLGLGDSCYSTQILSMLGSLYADNSAPAFALFNFTQSLSAAVAFFYSSHLILQWQLLILVIMNLLGFAAFAIVELRTSKPPERRYKRINNSEDVDSS